METEFCVLLQKLASGRGTRVGVELELSMQLNKACKSNSACALKKWVASAEFELEARGHGTRDGMELGLSAN